MDDAVIYVDVSVGDGKVGQIAVRRTDSAFELAETFCRAFDLDRSYIRRLALLVQDRLQEYLASEAQRRQDERERVLRGMGQGLAMPSEARTRAEIGQSTKAEEFRFHAPSVRPVLFKLRVEIAPGRAGLIAVRENDDPQVLARNFCKTFGLKASSRVTIVFQIQEHLTHYRLERLERMA
ncbi:hypothetical protein KIPB_004688 [Kipferlia bialata]|uniref:Uncharacterized protein n=1 Tax=Kipferlia bialata TaxID=797122 RepID=A0A391NVY3_9EUKA|nr:hypothetical protein KIPB_004688 [Kipferlia bialata]|eukprot:g4688.t1